MDPRIGFADHYGLNLQQLAGRFAGEQPPIACLLEKVTAG
jgi:hypothetical protein